MAKVYLAIHGETLWNIEKRVIGHHDISLSEHGINQAKAVAHHIIGHEINAEFMLCSPALRTIETAKIINKYLSQPCNIILESLLCPYNAGSWDGMLMKDVGVDINNLELLLNSPDGERKDIFFKRIDDIIKKISFIKNDTIIITHGLIALKILQSFGIEEKINRQMLVKL